MSSTKSWTQSCAGYSDVFNNDVWSEVNCDLGMGWLGAWGTDPSDCGSSCLVDVRTPGWLMTEVGSGRPGVALWVPRGDPGAPRARPREPEARAVEASGWAPATLGTGRAAAPLPSWEHLGQTWMNNYLWMDCHQGNAGKSERLLDYLRVFKKTIVFTDCILHKKHKCDSSIPL